MTSDKKGPYTVNRGHIEQDGYLLTNSEWHPTNIMGVDIGQPETGVRSLGADGEYNDFRLIQHGWWDFKKANDFILKGFKKGWDVQKIEDAMYWLRDRR